MNGPLDIALGWIGLYDGSGEVNVGADRQQATDLVLRIALDADSIASASCAACVTVILDPWFARGNLQLGGERMLLPCRTRRSLEVSLLSRPPLSTGVARSPSRSRPNGS